MKHAQCLNLVDLMGVKNVHIFHAERFAHIASDAVRDCARSWELSSIARTKHCEPVCRRSLGPRRRFLLSIPLAEDAWLPRTTVMLLKPNTVLQNASRPRLKEPN